MLGQLISSLDDPQVAAGLVAALNDPALLDRMAAIASDTGQAQTELVASAVRGFIDTASDDLWTQLIGIMNRAEDPGLAAMRAILTRAFPPASEVKS
ncbi:MAG: hypothetical protein J0H63_15135 [Rhizobiales bacterium]|jgi:hypothetical protein|nr:hypothetical protein [Hyphomicrobiales bacterium]MBN9011376.1 hypothetical protein [Hyphomicrobiales bacterium]